MVARHLTIPCDMSSTRAWLLSSLVCYGAQLARLRIDVPNMHTLCEGKCMLQVISAITLQAWVSVVVFG
jgi:hypothetical protein